MLADPKQLLGWGPQKRASRIISVSTLDHISQEAESRVAPSAPPLQCYTGIAKLRSFCLRQRSVGSEICDRFGRDRKGLAPGGHERELGSSTKGTEAAGPGLN